MQAALDTVTGPLWINGHSTRNGQNDQVPEAQTVSLPSSLYLIRPDNLRINVGVEGGVFGPAKRRVRAAFHLNGTSYNLVVTDPIVERRYLAGANGSFDVDDALLCVSLGEIWEGSAYKLVATVITSDMGA